MNKPKGDHRPGHDALFKHFLREPSTAQDFFAAHLPQTIRSQVQLETLRLEPGSFVDNHLRELHSDVLYSVRTTAGETNYIYCLVEHQSTPDRLMAWRLTRYAMSVMEAHLKKGNTRLPVVVPLLFYHGDVRPYPYVNDWLECFDNPTLARNIYTQAYPLVDVSVMTDDEVMSHRRMALLELVQRDIRHRDSAMLLADVVKLIREQINSREQVEAILTYIIFNGDSRTTQDTLSFIHQLAGEIPEHKELLMGTIAQQLTKQGIEQGIQQGIEQGIEQGIQQERQASQARERQVAEQTLLATAYALLDNGVSLEVVIKSTGLSRETLEQPRH